MANIMNDVPDYIEARIRQRPLTAGRVVAGSTPVVAFGNVLTATVATLGWNPSKLEFLDHSGNELLEDARRLETLASIGESDLVEAPAEAIRRVFRGCNDYFLRRPYKNWFNKLERILKHLDVSYYDGSACHLDFIQWATDPVWSKLPRDDQARLIKSDLPFLRRQLSQEKIRILLLNGRGIVRAYLKGFGGELDESTISGSPRVRLFTGRDSRGIKVIGWNINLQSSFGVSNEEIERIGDAVKIVVNSEGAR
jgi:hypothetical protein